MSAIKIGSMVKVPSAGNCYSSYRDMARLMDFTSRFRCGQSLTQGSSARVVALKPHEYNSRRIMAGLVDNEGNFAIYAVENLRLAEPAIRMRDMKVGQKVRCTSRGNGHHDHWGFEVGEVYDVKKHYSGVAGPSASGGTAGQNWAGWEFTLVEDAAPIIKATDMSTLQADKRYKVVAVLGDSHGNTHDHWKFRVGGIYNTAGAGRIADADGDKTGYNYGGWVFELVGDIVLTTEEKLAKAERDLTLVRQQLNAEKAAHAEALRKLQQANDKIAAVRRAAQ